MLKYIVNGEIMKNNWWNDGDSKFKKTLFIFVNWWNDGNNKVLKAFYFSLFIHFVNIKIYLRIKIEKRWQSSLLYF